MEAHLRKTACQHLIVVTLSHTKLHFHVVTLSHTKLHFHKYRRICPFARFGVHRSVGNAMNGLQCDTLTHSPHSRLANENKSDFVVNVLTSTIQNQKKTTRRTSKNK